MTTAVTPSFLFSGLLTASTPAVLFQASSTCVITSLALSNTSTAHINTVTLYLVRSGGGPGLNNQLTPARVVGPGIPVLAIEWWGRNLAVGDLVFGLATNAGEVLVIADGYTYST